MFPPVCSALLRLHTDEYIFTALNITDADEDVKRKVKYCSVFFITTVNKGGYSLTKCLARMPGCVKISRCPRIKYGASARNDKNSCVMPLPCGPSGRVAELR